MAYAIKANHTGGSDCADNSGCPFELANPLPTTLLPRQQVAIAVIEREARPERPHLR